MGRLVLLQPDAVLIEGAPVHDAGEGILQQRILPLQQMGSDLIYLAEAAVHEPGVLPVRDGHRIRALPDIVEGALDQRLLLAKDPHQENEAA
ncbi:hypothetical protein D3C85_1520730 [compost metagenome]